MIKKVINAITALINGHVTVLKNAFRKRITLEYPEKKKIYNDRFRGKIDFNKDTQGHILCTGCGICQRVCPCKDLIKIERSKDEYGKFKLDSYKMNLTQCIFCGNCVEYCPNNALKMTDNYELAVQNKNDLVLELKGN